MNRLPLNYSSAWNLASAHNWIFHSARRNSSIMGHKPNHVTIKAADNSVVCLTQPCGTLGDHVQYGLNIARRISDDTQDFTRRRLLLQCFSELAIAVLNSLNSRTFSMAITAWSAKVLTSSICRSVNGSTKSRQIVMVPSPVPSRNKGTANNVRTPESDDVGRVCRAINCASAACSRASRRWIGLRSRKARAPGMFGLKGRGLDCKTAIRSELSL